MAKKKKIAKGASHQDVDELSKSQVKAYHKEINEFYAEHGWRTTLSQYLLSPIQAGVIVKETRKKMEKAAKLEKAAKKKARAEKKKNKASKKKAPKRAPKKEAKAEKAPKKAKKTKKTKAKAAKKEKRAKSVKVASVAADNEGVLDFLLAYRNGNGSTPISLDTVIADLATQVRAA